MKCIIVSIILKMIVESKMYPSVPPVPPFPPFIFSEKKRIPSFILPQFSNPFDNWFNYKKNQSFTDIIIFPRDISREKMDSFSDLDVVIFYLLI